MTWRRIAFVTLLVLPCWSGCPSDWFYTVRGRIADESGRPLSARLCKLTVVDAKGGAPLDDVCVNPGSFEERMHGRRGHSVAFVIDCGPGYARARTDVQQLRDVIDLGTIALDAHPSVDDPISE